MAILLFESTDSGWAPLRATPVEKAKGFQRTVKLLRQPPWNMDRAADYLSSWLEGVPYALATASEPAVPSWMAMLGNANTVQPPVRLGVDQTDDFAQRPAKILKVGAGAPDAGSSRRGRRGAAGRGEGGRHAGRSERGRRAPGRPGRGRGRGKGAGADDLLGLSDLSGMELLDGVSSPSSSTDA